MNQQIENRTSYKKLELRCKKIFAVLLSVSMILLAASGCKADGNVTQSTSAPKTSVLRVGYSSVDITPKESVPLAGSGGAGISSTSRMSEEVVDPLYATCVAFTDETDNTVLLFNLDILYAYDENNTLQFAARDIFKATGVPANQIMITSTHNHHAPDMRVDFPSITDYNKSIRAWMVDAAQKALADREAAKMFVTSAYPKGQNFVRHYKMSDGSVAGSNFGDFKNNTILGHVRDADNQMQLVKFTREGKKDLILVNWQAHPFTGGYTHSIISNIYHMRKMMEDSLNCQFAYLLGASGNVTSSSRIESEKDGATYIQRYQKLAQYAIDAAASFEQVSTGKVQILGQQYKATKKTGDETLDVPIYAFSVGDVAFVTAPYEMFCENGEQIKQGSPFKMTMVATCANGNRSYIPSKECYEYPDAYEIQGCKFVPGTGELLVEQFTIMLKELYKTK